jgi:hypothetical protein
MELIDDKYVHSIVHLCIVPDVQPQVPIRIHIAAPPSLFHPAAYPVVKPATDMIARKINATILRAATLAVQISTSQPTRYGQFRRSEGDRTPINDNPPLF